MTSNVSGTPVTSASQPFKSKISELEGKRVIPPCLKNSMLPDGSKPICASPNVSRSNRNPSNRVWTNSRAALSPNVIRSAINSVALPKHANPAFLEVPPPPNGSESKTAILQLGCCFCANKAAERPTIPPPTIPKSNPSSHSFDSQ